MSDCWVQNYKSNGRKICVPELNNKFKIQNKKLFIEKKIKGKIKKVLEEHSGASKKNIYEIKIGNLYYISYTEDYTIPKNKNNNFINLNESHLYKFKGKEKKTLEDLFREIDFHTKINNYYNNLTPKIVSSSAFLVNNELRFQILSESAQKNNFDTVGDFIDNDEIDISFKLVDVYDIPTKKDLYYYMKEVQKNNKKIKNVDLKFYAKFLNPKYLKENLEIWYKNTKYFFTPFFKSLHKLHLINVYHHDLHAKNVWCNENLDFKFIDYGRSSTLKESLEITFPINRYKSNIYKLEHQDKKNIKTIINSIKKSDPQLKKKNNRFQILKCLMLAELNYPDKIKFVGIRQNMEYFRHDIDEAILLQCFGKDKAAGTFLKTKNQRKIKEFEETHNYYYSKVLRVFKEFIAEKYAEANVN